MNPTKTKIVYLCGSLRFKDEFQKQEIAHLMRGEIALLPCCMFTDIQREHGEDSEYKRRSDEQHKRKIEIADEVFVLNVGGYIGSSTADEIAHAVKIGKPVLYFEPLLEISCFIDSEIGMTMGETKLEKLPDGTWLATCPIGTLFGSDVEGECRGVGSTKEAALEALAKDRKNLNESLWA